MAEKYKFYVSLADGDVNVVVVKAEDVKNFNNIKTYDPEGVPDKYVQARLFGSAGQNVFCCGITQIGELSVRFASDLTYEEAAKLLNQGLIQLLKEVQNRDNRYNYYEDEKVAKLIASDVQGHNTSKFCTAAGWYCSPYPSINPKTGNKIMIYELGLDNA